MSLRKKILLLFGLLAIVPLLILAAFSYWHAQNLLREAVQEQLQQMALAIGQELAEARAGIDSDLGVLASALEGEPVSGDELPGQAVAAQLGPVLALASYVGARSANGSLRFLAGSVPNDPTRCTEGVGSHLVIFSRGIPHSSDELTLEAGFWASDLVTRQVNDQARSVAVVDPADGSALYTNGCGPEGDGRLVGVASGLGNALEMPGSQGTFRFKDEEGAKVGAFARVADPDWYVVATSSLADVLGSLQRLTLMYWMFVLALGLSTAFVFSVMIGRFTRTLSGLVRAAEEIGLGELDPWLPLPASGELGQLTLAFSRMLARIRQMMIQVNHSGRLAVVGELSAYLAHEIRNPLSSIKLNLQRLRRWARNGSIPEFCLEPLEISLREVERLNASVTGVLQLSKAQDSPREVVSLHHLVEEAADLFASKFRRQGVGLSLDLDAEADLVLARSGQLKSVILNLMVNALEAQPHGGRLEIRTVLGRMPELGGPAVSIHFRDEGAGVPPEIRDRIFEPFFTSKAGGSGIGLAVANQSVRDNGGELYLEPSFSGGTGAEFVAVFPLASSEARARTWVNPASSEGISEEENGAPRHLMTPEGLRAALASPDPEESN